MDHMAPDFQILCDGQRLPEEAAQAIVAITVDLSVDLADMFQLKLRNEGFAWSDSDLFADGTRIKIDLGYVGDLKTVIEGEVTCVEASFPRRGPSTLKVSGYDRVHRLRRGRKSRSFLQARDSDIVRQVAADHGMAVELEETSVIHPYVFQHNQSDLDFLLERAARIDYLIRVVGNTLIFKRPDTGRGQMHRLKWGEDLVHFRPSVSLADQVSLVEVRAWDVVEKREIVARARGGALHSAMGGEVAGPHHIQQALGRPSDEVIIDMPVASQAEADSIAIGRLNQRARSFVSGTGSSRGNPRLLAGEVIDLEACGELFSGSYFLTTVKHVLTRTGYTTGFSARRTALGQEAEPPPRQEVQGKRRSPLEIVPRTDEKPKPALVNARWSKEMAREREVVTLLVEAYHLEGQVASFKIYHRDRKGKTRFLEERTATIANQEARQSFSYTWREDNELQPADFFFKVEAATLEANSGFLRVRNETVLDFSLANTDIPLAGALFVAELPDGSRIRGRLDENGKATLPELSPGKFHVVFPEFEEVQEQA